MDAANEAGSSLNASQRLLSEVLLAPSTTSSRQSLRHKRRRISQNTARDVGQSSTVPDPLTGPDEESAASTLKSHLQRVSNSTTLVLTNPARPRPLPPADSTLGRQLRKRDRRVEDRARKEDMIGRKGKAAGSTSEGGKDEETEREANTALSRKSRKRLGFLDKHPNLSYATLEPLSTMWASYVQQVLGWRDEAGQVNNATVRALFQPGDQKTGTLSGALRDYALTGIQTTLSKVDLTGASVRVIRCSDPARVGFKGLVARETENTFVIAVEPAQISIPTTSLPTGAQEDEALRQRRPVRSLTKRAYQTGKSGETRVVPKHNAVFEVLVPIPPTSSMTSTAPEAAEQLLAVPLYGNQMSQGFPTRATKKHKARKSVDF